MKILYGVQGTGNGHITRARAMAAELAKQHIDVTYLFSGRPREDYFDMEPFGDFLCFNGLTFTTEQGRIKHLRTLKDAKIRQFWKDLNSLDINGYDLIISDFEPLTSWAARRRGRRVIGIGHQYAFNHAIPLAGDNWLARAIMKYFAPATTGLGLHWHHFGQPILPPIITPHATAAEQTETGHNILVYLPFEDASQVVTMLQGFSSHRFDFFTNAIAPGQQLNVTVHPQSRDGFQQTLLTAAGVIANSGFELTSEALDLGKRILVKPVAGQMEQISNAKALTQLQLGHSMDQLNPIAIEHWLKHAQPAQVKFPNVAAGLVNWLQQGAHEQHIEQLAEQLWAQTHSPHIPDYASRDQTDSNAPIVGANHYSISL